MGRPPAVRYALKVLSITQTRISTHTTEETTMLWYAVVFLIIAIVAGFFGFLGVAGLAATIAKILFIIFLILFVVSLISGRRRG